MQQSGDFLYSLRLENTRCYHLFLTLETDRVPDNPYDIKCNPSKSDHSKRLH